MGRRRRGAAAGHDADALRGGAGGALEEGAGRVGPGRRAHRAAARRRRLRHLHARQPRRRAGLDPQLVCGAAGRGSRRRRAARASAPAARRRACWRSPGVDGRPPRSREHTLRRRPPRRGLGGGRGPRSRRAHPAGSDAAVRRRSAWSISKRSSRRRTGSSWRCASTALLAAPGFDAWLEGEPLDSGSLLYTAAGQAARGDLLDRAPGRRRAHVLRLAAAQPGRRVDARADRHLQPARDALHGRDRSGTSRRSRIRRRRRRC